MERVSTIEGGERVIILSPHSCDDTNTAIIAETIADKLDAYAVINRGWERASEVDFWTDKANCNDIEHLHKPVVKEEFLDPIFEQIYKIRRDPSLQCSPTVYIFTIHGFSSKKTADIVIGYGNGNPKRYTCDLWRKDALGFYLAKIRFEVFEGAAGSDYAGWGKKNLNQLSQTNKSYGWWYPDPHVQSMQLEISRDWRINPKDAEEVGTEIAGAIDDLLCHEDTSPINDRTITNLSKLREFS